MARVVVLPAVVVAVVVAPAVPVGLVVLPAVVRVVVTDGAIRFVRVAVGGVANTPLRLTAVEQRLLAQRPSPALLLDASGLVGQGTRSPPGAAHKLEILRATVLTALERALAPADPEDRP